MNSDGAVSGPPWEVSNAKEVKHIIFYMIFICVLIKITSFYMILICFFIKIISFLIKIITSKLRNLQNLKKRRLRQRSEGRDAQRK